MKTNKNIFKWIRKIVIVVIIVVAAIYIGARIVEVNAEYPQVEKVTIKQGTAQEIQDGVTMTVDAVNVLGREESISKYGEEIEEEMYEDYDFRTFLIDVSFENTSDIEQSVVVYNIYLENNVYSQGIVAEIFSELDEEYDMSDMTIESGETISLTLPYVVFEYQFSSSQWEKIDDMDFYLVDQRYPVKYYWEF